MAASRLPASLLGLAMLLGVSTPSHAVSETSTFLNYLSQDHTCGGAVSCSLIGDEIFVIAPGAGGVTEFSLTSFNSVATMTVSPGSYIEFQSDAFIGATTAGFQPSMSFNSLSGIIATMILDGNGAFYGGVLTMLATGRTAIENQIHTRAWGDFSFATAGVYQVVTRVTNDPEILPPPIPEPTTWLMMLAGIGAVGLKMYRANGRRRTN